MIKRVGQITLTLMLLVGTGSQAFQEQTPSSHYKISKSFILSSMDLLPTAARSTAAETTSPGLLGYEGDTSRDTIKISAADDDWILFLPSIFAMLSAPISSGDCPAMVGDARVPKNTALKWLNIHNALRNRYCVPPLQWDADLAKVAQDYANLGAWDLPHNPNRRAQYAALIGCDIASEWCPAVGENVHFHAPWHYFPFSGCFNGMINEESSSQCNSGGAHYTTMMAARYTRLGCGGYIDNQNRFHLVCNYAESEPYTGPNPFPAENCSCTPEPFSPSVTSCYE